jgi:hypothetical protein
MVAPEVAVDGCTSSAEGVAANTTALKLAHNDSVPTAITNVFIIWLSWTIWFIWLVWSIWFV